MHTGCMGWCLRLFLTNSAQEREIIEHPSSCYVIGRSGTGKTTIMIFKMLDVQRTWQQHSNTDPKPRQVFVTRSPILATKAEEYFAKLMSSPEAVANPLEEPRVTLKDVEQEPDSVDPGGGRQWRSELPEKYSDLSDEHFPLFTTYDQVRICLSSKHLISPSRKQLYTMLQNDVGEGNDNDGFIIPKTHVLGDKATSPTSSTSPQKSRLRAKSGSMYSSDYTHQLRRNFVSYGVFLASYWDHLPQTFTRALGEK